MTWKWPSERLVAATLLLAGGLAAVTVQGQEREFEPVTVPMTAIRVAPQSYYVLGQSGMISQDNQGFNANAGFVVTSDGVVVFDALGTPALGKRLAQVIADITPQPVRRVVISHYHADHFYGLQGLVKPGVEVWAQELVRDYLATAAAAERLTERRQSLAPWVNSLSRIVEPTHFIGDEATFRLGGLTFHLLHAGPAHTPEDLMMLVEEEGVLFVGDLMVTGRIPYVADADVSSWIKAIDQVLTMKPRVVVVGHGTASDNAIADLSLTRDYLVYLRSNIAAAFEEGLDFNQAYKRIDWSGFEHLPAFEAANRRNAYQAYLNVEREALEAIKTGQ